MKNKKPLYLMPTFMLTNDEKRPFLIDHYVKIVDDVIVEIGPSELLMPFSDSSSRYVLMDGILIPGFVQTHIHLCQTLFKNSAEDLQLLDWLTKRIFPFEKNHTERSLKASASLGLYELMCSGTTTILDMGSLNGYESILEVIRASKIRAFVGKAMMDRNDLYPSYKNSTTHELEESYRLAEKWHNSNNGLIKYAFAPRFVLSCTEDLMIQTKKMAATFEGSLFHTHASENKNECQIVRDMTGMDNIEYFDSIGVLDEKTVLAHCIHLTEKEKDILRDRKVRVAHCPSSNLKLGSGIAPIPDLIAHGVSVSIGTDGAACNNHLSMINEAHIAALIQKPFYGPTAMDATTVFKMATIEGAKALGIDNIVGSIEIGKKADLVHLDSGHYFANPFFSSLEAKETITEKALCEAVIHSATDKNVSEVFINGECVVAHGSHRGLDGDMLVNKAHGVFGELFSDIF